MSKGVLIVMKILDFPELRQTYEYDCGAKAVQAVLAYYGIELREELLLRSAKTTEREGTTINGILHTVKIHELMYRSESMTIQDVLRFIDKKIPVLLLLQAWSGKNKDYRKDYRDGHWVVAIGYSSSRILFEDPYAFERAFLTYRELMDRWHAKENGRKIIKHGIAVYGKDPAYSSKKIIHME